MKEFEKWIKKAEGDLYNVELLLKSENCQTDICCFHAQQAAEKYLKSYLVRYNIDFPKTHDLIELMNLCKTKNLQFEQLKPFCLR
ncbi:MAG TPA: HEPN domain-containing protein, partial [Puia sp.]